MFERFLFGVVVLLSIFIMPWWISSAIVIVLIFRYIPYYEAFVFGIILDALYNGAYGFGFIFVFLTSVLFFVSLYVKDKMRVS